MAGIAGLKISDEAFDDSALEVTPVSGRQRGWSRAGMAPLPSAKNMRLSQLGLDLSEKGVIDFDEEEEDEEEAPPEAAERSGFMQKKSGVLSGFKRRYFVLPPHGTLLWFKSEKDKNPADGPLRDGQGLEHHHQPVERDLEEARLEARGQLDADLAAVEHLDIEWEPLRAQDLVDLLRLREHVLDLDAAFAHDHIRVRLVDLVFGVAVADGEEGAQHLGQLVVDDSIHEGRHRAECGRHGRAETRCAQS